ncbi:MAG: TlpA family protein disulfide reductase [Neomegalonema sp.]|nr:TlpA family protein disulfide reductase [Neomegalonema sp.]
MKRISALAAALLASLATLAVLYGAGVFETSPATAAEPTTPAELSELRLLTKGSLEKMLVHQTPRPVAREAFRRENGRKATLADFQGRVLLVNFWATWCAPCKREMPSLDALQKARGSRDFEVVTISTDRQGARVARRFFDQAGIKDLALFVDQDSSLARAMDVKGLPVSVLIDRSGHEVARLVGEAAWDSAEVTRLIDQLVSYP